MFTPAVLMLLSLYLLTLSSSTEAHVPAETKRARTNTAEKLLPAKRKGDLF